MNNHYSIVVSDNTQKGFEPAEARKNLSRLLKVSDEKLDELLKQGRLTVKKDLDRETAEKYYQLISETGVTCEIEGTELSLEDLPEVPATQADTPRAPSASTPFAAPQADLVNAEKAFCRYCGQQLKASVKTCPHCGAKQITGEPKSQKVAATLAILCGGLGIHRFYLSQWWGIFYIILWPLSSIWSVGEGIYFLLTSKGNWERKYGSVVGGSIIGVVIVAVFIGVIILGILAAIAIPAYQDYIVRAKVAANMPFVEQQLSKVAEKIQQVGFYPNQNLDAGLPKEISNADIKSVVVTSGGHGDLSQFAG